ncbi:ATP-binding protein [Streptomyces pratens]|uniref:ATP-binding protein n=1 Tax=Streptomyces pratens TaxID=887456 RepID=A0ABW1M481_9ACTN
MHSPSPQRHRLLSTGPTAPAEFALSFTSTPRGARLARLFVAHRLDTWGHPYTGDVNETLTLIAAELCANAVRHGRVPGRDFHVRLTTEADGGRLRVEVSDTRAERRPAVTAPADSDAEPAAASSSSPPWPTTGASPTAAPAPARRCGPCWRRRRAVGRALSGRHLWQPHAGLPTSPSPRGTSQRKSNERRQIKPNDQRFPSADQTSEAGVTSRGFGLSRVRGCPAPGARLETIFFGEEVIFFSKTDMPPVQPFLPMRRQTRRWT